MNQKYPLLKFNHQYLMKNKHSRRYEAAQHPDDLMLGCADTDVQFPDAIKKTICYNLTWGDLSYSYFNNAMISAINKWYQHFYEITFPKSTLLIANGVVQLIQVAVAAFTDPHDEVLVQAPAYQPFWKIVTNKNRQLLVNRLQYCRQTLTYQINWADFTRKCQNPRCKVFILCSPHNPTGKVFSQTEIARMSQICAQNQVIIVADEIWSDIHNQNVAFHSVDQTAEHYNNIIVTSGSKTFNMGASNLGFALVRDPVKYEQMELELNREIHISSHNTISCIMLCAGYSEPECLQWLTQYNALITNNRNQLRQALHAKTAIKVIHSEATALAWLDFSAVCQTPTEIIERCEKIGIYGCAGTEFETERRNMFLRLMICIAPSQLEKLIERFTNEFA